STYTRQLFVCSFKEQSLCQRRGAHSTELFNTVNTFLKLLLNLRFVQYIQNQNSEAAPCVSSEAR
ncbi:MAG: hypothetical protein WAO71_16075, partial [Gallionella sp.]